MIPETNLDNFWQKCLAEKTSQLFWGPVIRKVNLSVF